MYVPVSFPEEVAGSTPVGGDGGGVTGNSSSTGLVQTVEGGVVTKRSSRIAGMSKKEESKCSPSGVISD